MFGVMREKSRGKGKDINMNNAETRERKGHAFGAAIPLCALAVAVGAAALHAQDAAMQSSKNASTSVVTNENGIVTRTFKETNVTTNGTFVTKRVRVTKTTMDPDGNVIGTSTAESSRSNTEGARYWIEIDEDEDGDPFGSFDWVLSWSDDPASAVLRGEALAVEGLGSPRAHPRRPGKGKAARKGAPPRRGGPQAGKPGERPPEESAAGKEAGNGQSKARPPEKDDFSFLGVKLGATPEEAGLNAVEALPLAKDWTVSPLGLEERVVADPPKKLSGFDTYRIGLTPKTHRIACYSVTAPLKRTPGERGGGDVEPKDYGYILKALVQKYGESDKKLRGFSGWDLGGRRFLTLTYRANGNHASIFVQDADLCEQGRAEAQEIRDEKRKAAALEADRWMQEALDAF